MLLFCNKRANINKVQRVLLTYVCCNGTFNSVRTLSTSNALEICIIAGSTRTSGPPRPILSDRVTSYIQASIAKREPSHDVTILKARETLPLLERPHFTYPPSQMPENLKELHKILEKADAYITVTPEYNHAPCPGLMNLMNHFGSSTFGFKPSGIVSYSAGQWGGTRAAHSLRPFLSELGCLPVSAMVHVPKAGEVFDPEGRVLEDLDEDHWDRYVDRLLCQLEWWGEAARIHKAAVDPQSVSPAFTKNPSQRNAPID
jgi:chromate reductase